MKTYLLQAEHFSNPGRILTAHATRESAEDEAVELVNIMLHDDGHGHRCGRANWSDKIAYLQDKHGAQYCYVEIDEKEIVNRIGDAPADPLRDAAPAMLAALIDAVAMLEHYASGKPGNWDGSTKGQALATIREGKAAIDAARAGA